IPHRPRPHIRHTGASRDLPDVATEPGAAGGPGVRSAARADGDAGSRAVKSPKIRKAKKTKLSSFERKIEGEIARVREELDAIAGTPGPVIAGPYMSEVG